MIRVALLTERGHRLVSHVLGLDDDLRNERKT